MKKTIILIVILFIAVIVVSSLYFSRLSQTQNASKRYIAAIPADASLLVSFNNDSTFYDLFKNYQGFEFLLGKEEMKDLRTLKDTFLKNTTFSTLASQQPIYISFHAKEDSVNWLLSMPFKKVNDPDFFQNNLDSSVSVQSIQSSVGEYYELKVPAVSRKIYASIQPENIMFSFSKSLLESAIDKKSNHLSELFLDKFQENNHRNSSPLQLYVNHDRLKNFLSSITKKTSNTLALFESLNGISMLDLNYKSNVVMFSGTSSVAVSDSSYLSLFITQKPVSHQLKNWLPKNVAEVATYGISDYRGFHAGLEKILTKRKDINQLQEQIRYIENKNDVVIDDELLTIWGNEFATLTLKSGVEIGLIAIRDSLEYSLIADKISTVNADSTSRQFDNSNLLYYSLGDPFKDFKRPYFAYSNGYLVVANNQRSLFDYLAQVKDQELLINEADYALYDKLQSASSNFSLFIHRENSNRAIERNLSKPFLKNYNDKQNFGYDRFYAFSLQLSGNGDQFLVNLYGEFNEENESGDLQ